MARMAMDMIRVIDAYGVHVNPRTNASMFFSLEGERHYVGLRACKLDKDGSFYIKRHVVDRMLGEWNLVWVGPNEVIHKDNTSLDA